MDVTERTQFHRSEADSNPYSSSPGLCYKIPSLLINECSWGRRLEKTEESSQELRCTLLHWDKLERVVWGVQWFSHSSEEQGIDDY